MTAALHVACATGEDYAPHAAAMLHSVHEHSGGLPVHAHVLHPPVMRAGTRRKLRLAIEGAGGVAHLHEIADARVDGLPDLLDRGIPRTLWYRIYLPELLPDEPRVLYLDCDILALDDLRPLWVTDLGDGYLGAVTNVWEPWNAGYPGQLGLQMRDYLNSGVLLLDLEAMRRDRITQALLDYANAHELTWADQDALSAVLGPGRVHLHPRWNAMNSVLTFDGAVDVFGEEAVAEARARPGLRHFEGPSVNKPWHLLCGWRDRETYRRHRRATPWPRYVPTGVTPRNLWVYARRRARARRRVTA